MIGPDNRVQPVSVCADATSIVELYKQRLEISLKSKFEVKPFKVVIADLEPSGLQVAEKV